LTTATDTTFAPVPTPDSEFFWEGLRQGKLVMPHCTSCDRHFFPPMPGCPYCGADAEKVERVEASGEGTVYSWIVAYHAFDPAFAGEVPYTILTVDLAEGARIIGRLKGTRHDAVQAGMRVRAQFEDRGDFTILCFTPVGT
jgi:uncharacterized OB-fold protein